jgi:uncharacterized protein (DUF362 family)
MSKVFVSGVKKGISDESLISTIKKVLLDSTNNLAFLKPGETVLLKPALNSGDPFPATTHPLAIRAVAEILEERGAKVVVGDQSGMEHVLHCEKGVVRGSSKKNYYSSGMSEAGREFVAFEEGDWEKDFLHFQSEKASSWPNGFYISRWVEKVDHIINLPRVSAHSLSGVTLGFKNFVGFLREDSRMEFHADGPLYGLFVALAGKKIKTDYQNSEKFIEKISEISLAVKDKLRATLFVATKAQTTLGPDRKNAGPFKAYVAEPDTGLVFASDNQVAVELFAISFLMHLYKNNTPRLVKVIEDNLLFFTKRYRRFHKGKACENDFIQSAIALGLGSKDGNEIIWNDVTEDVRVDISF